MTLHSRFHDRRPRVLLQFYRGIAAVMVVMFHAALVTRKYCEVPDFGRHFLGGDMGVPFFFVLSGFVIAYAQQGKGSGLTAAKQFLARRSRRIYFPYWAVCLLVLPIVIWQARGAAGLGWVLFTGWFLLPSGTPPFLGVAWTLVHELLFYVCFSLTVLSGRIGWLGFAGWQAAIVLTWLAGWSLAGAGLHYVLSPLNLLFSLGLLAYWAPLAGRAAGWLAYAAGNAVFFAIVFLSHPAGDWLFPPEYWRSMAAGAGALLIVYGCTHPAVESALQGFGSKVALLGDASYAVYLIHYPLLSVLGKVIGSQLGASCFYVAAVAACICAGCAFHLLIEKRLIKPN